MFSGDASKIGYWRVRTTRGVTAVLLSLAALPSFGASLSGRITHSEYLEPMSAEDEIGQIFESTQLYKKMMACRNGKLRKFIIPAWLAGTWSRTESTETSRIELPSGRRLQARGSVWRWSLISLARIKTASV